MDSVVNIFKNLGSEIERSVKSQSIDLYENITYHKLFHQQVPLSHNSELKSLHIPLMINRRITTREKGFLCAWKIFIFGIYCCTQNSLSFQMPHAPSTMMSSERCYKINTSLSALTWRPLQDLMETTYPAKLCNANSETPRLAKDSEYATAVLKAWKEDSSSYTPDQKNVGTKFVYLESKEGTNLHGFLVAPSYLIPTTPEKQKLTLTDQETKKEPLSAIILFHTGAGPQDMFLRWKADILAKDLNCVVMIADIIGDAEGYAWSDRNKYDAARKSVLAASEEGGQVARWKLRRTITAAINSLKELEGYFQIDQISALGWCMGGHPILELGLMKEKSIKTLVSYHGVFDGVNDYKKEFQPGRNDDFGDAATNTCTRKTKVLICNGKSDPFVHENDINKAKSLLEMKGCDVEILNFEGVKHGFTNPAQDYNPSDAFAFNKNAANASWEATIQILKQETIA